MGGASAKLCPPFSYMNAAMKRGKIIIVEGVWGAGKSTFIKELAQKLRAVSIPEPDHRGHGLKGPRAMTRWYLDAHRRNVNRAMGYARKGRAVLIERSILASAAYSVLLLNGGDCQPDVEELKRQIRSARKERIGFKILYLKPRDIPGTVARMRHIRHLKQFADEGLVVAFDRHLRKAIKTINK